jgi:hypothetical protein
MTIFRTAVALDVKPGHEPAYLDWVRGCIRTLGPVYARTGITRKAVVMQGRHVIAHYEAQRPGAVEEAFASPEAATEFAGVLGAITDFSSPPQTFHGVLHWARAVSYAPKHVALTLRLKAGAEPTYLEWVQNRLTPDFDGIWRDADLARKEVLVSGRHVIAFYEARDSASVLSTFARPESVRVMESFLGALLDPDPERPMVPYEEVFLWEADRADGTRRAGAA